VRERKFTRYKYLILCLMAAQALGQAVAPTRRYDFWTVKPGFDGRIQDQIAPGNAANDIIF
jgi:hypothetical protein